MVAFVFLSYIVPDSLICRNKILMCRNTIFEVRNMRNGKSQQDSKENTQKKMNKFANPVLDDSQNQNHNTKKVALGPNTKR